MINFWFKVGHKIGSYQIKTMSFRYATVQPRNSFQKIPPPSKSILSDNNRGEYEDNMDEKMSNLR